MKKQTNAILYVFLFIFISVNVLLHRDGAPLYPYTKHALARSSYLVEHTIVHTDGKTVENRQAHKIKQHKLRVRYKASDVRFTLDLPSPVFLERSDYRIVHSNRPELFHLFQPYLFSDLRGPPSHV